MFLEELWQKADETECNLIPRINMIMDVEYVYDEATLLELLYQGVKKSHDLVPAFFVTRSVFEALSITQLQKLTSFDNVFIADLKLADTLDVDLWSAEVAADAGFDAVTVHGFVGEDIIETLRESFDLGILLVYGMSDLMIKHEKEYLKMAKRVDGLVVPRDVDIVKRIRAKYGGLLIGGDFGEEFVPLDALRYGADFECVDVLRYKDPREHLIILREEAKQI